MKKILYFCYYKKNKQTRTSLHQTDCSYLCLLVVMTCTYVCTAHRYGYVLDTHKSFQHLQIKPHEKRKTQRQHHTVFSEACEERHVQRKPIYLYSFCFLLLPELSHLQSLYNLLCYLWTYIVSAWLVRQPAAKAAIKRKRIAFSQKSKIL